jgi:hypothetical protein
VCIRVEKMSFADFAGAVLKCSKSYKPLFAEHQKNDIIKFLYRTKVFYNQI